MSDPSVDDARALVIASEIASEITSEIASLSDPSVDDARALVIDRFDGGGNQRARDCLVIDRSDGGGVLRTVLGAIGSDLRRFHFLAVQRSGQRDPVSSLGRVVLRMLVLLATARPLEVILVLLATARPLEVMLVLLATARPLEVIL